MDPLEDIHEKIYTPEGEKISERPYSPSVLEPEDASAKPHPDTAPRKWSGKRVFELSRGNSRLLWGGAIFLTVLLIASGFAIFWGTVKSCDVEKQVPMRIRNIEQITSGDEVLYTVEVGNTCRIRLEDAELVFRYPEGSFSFGEGSGLLPISSGASEARALIGDIDPGEQVVREFKARLIGGENETKFANATLSFTPSSINRQLTLQRQSPVTIATVPINIVIDAPKESLSNKEVFYTINYVNTSKIAFENLRLRVQYPRGFTFVASRPIGEQDNTIWNIDRLSQGEEGTISINGIFKGEPDENMVLEAFIERQNGEQVILFTSERKVTRLVASPLSIQLLVNRKEEYNASLGEKLVYTIKFRNDFDVPLQEVFLKAQLVGSMFDVKSVVASGAFDVTTNEITWTALEVPELLSLEPREEGSVDFIVQLKDRFPINSFNDKNFFIKVVGQIGTDIVPRFLGVDSVGQETSLVTKLKTTTVLKAPGFYTDPSSGIDNSGSIPPRVGSDTSYTVHWQILNTANDLRDVVVKAKLPTAVTWTDHYDITSRTGAITYNASSKEVVWNVGRVPATTGIALPVIESVFQVQLRPSPSMIDQVGVLLLESELSGIDEYTGEQISTTASVITTALPSDSSVAGRKAVIVAN